MFENFNKRLIREGEIANFGVAGRVLGFCFDLQYPSYRGTYLSCIDDLTVWIDGEEIPEPEMAFCLNGKQFGIHELPELFREYWFIRDYATLQVYRSGGLEPGSVHSVKVRMGHHIAYTNYSGDGKYSITHVTRQQDMKVAI